MDVKGHTKHLLPTSVPWQALEAVFSIRFLADKNAAKTQVAGELAAIVVQLLPLSVVYSILRLLTKLDVHSMFCVVPTRQSSSPLVAITETNGTSGLQYIRTTGKFVTPQTPTYAVSPPGLKSIARGLSLTLAGIPNTHLRLSLIVALTVSYAYHVPVV